MVCSIRHVQVVRFTFDIAPVLINELGHITCKHVPPHSHLMRSRGMIRRVNRAIEASAIEQRIVKQ